MRITAIADRDLFAFTGLNSAQFWTLVDRLWAVHPDQQRGRPWVLDFADRVLLIAMAYRTNLTDRQLSVVFAVSKSTVDRVLHDLAPHLANLLDTPPTDRRELWLVDGTLIPVHDHSRTAKSKTSHVVERSSPWSGGEGQRGREGSVGGVRCPVLQAVEEAAEGLVEQVPQGGGVAFSASSSPVVMGAWGVGAECGEGLHVSDAGEPLVLHCSGHDDVAAA